MPSGHILPLPPRARDFGRAEDLVPASQSPLFSSPAAHKLLTNLGGSYRGDWKASSAGGTVNQQKGPSFLLRLSSGQGLHIPLLEPNPADWKKKKDPRGKAKKWSKLGLPGLKSFMTWRAESAWSILDGSGRDVGVWEASWGALGLLLGRRLCPLL